MSDIVMDINIQDNEDVSVDILEYQHENILNVNIPDSTDPNLEIKILGDSFTLEDFLASDEQKAINEKINNLQIGGRNYILGTGTPYTATGNPNTKLVLTPFLAPNLNIATSLYGKTVTLSFDYEANITSGSLFISFYKTWQFVRRFYPSDTSGHIEFTVELQVPSEKDQRFIYLEGTWGGTLTISNLKLEIGNKATDWTPALEDPDFGGRNYARNTSNAVTGTANDATGGSDGYTIADAYWRGMDVRIDAAKEYTLSFDYEFDWSECATAMPTALAGIAVNIFRGTGSDLVTNIISKDADYFTYGNGYSKGRFVITFPGSDDAANPCFAFRALRSYGPDITGLKLTISNFMLEAGSKPSAWVHSLQDRIMYAPQYELLGSVTLAEAVNEVLFDGFGILKEFYLDVTMEAGESDVLGYVQARVSKSTNGVGLSIANFRRTTKRYTRVSYKERPNGMTEFFATAPGTEAKSGSTCAGMGFFLNSNDVGCVRTYLTQGNLFPAGSKFELWGVKE